jgi:hypothetical protein
VAPVGAPIIGFWHVKFIAAYQLNHLALARIPTATAHSDGCLSFTAKGSLCLFRVAQEAISNAMKDGFCRYATMESDLT